MSKKKQIKELKKQLKKKDKKIEKINQNNLDCLRNYDEEVVRLNKLFFQIRSMTWLDNPQMLIRKTINSQVPSIINIKDMSDAESFPEEPKKEIRTERDHVILDDDLVASFVNIIDAAFSKMGTVEMIHTNLKKSFRHKCKLIREERQQEKKSELD